jgi:hypothetical protein
MRVITSTSMDEVNKPGSSEPLLSARRHRLHRGHGDHRSTGTEQMSG